MLDAIDLTIAYDKLGFSIPNRRDDFFNAAPTILIIAIGVHDNICAKLQALIDPDRKGMGQSAIKWQPYDMVNAARPGNFRSPIRTAVIDDQKFDFIEAFYFTRQIPNRKRQCFCFIETRNLNNQLQNQPLTTIISIKFACRTMGLIPADHLC